MIVLACLAALVCFLLGLWTLGYGLVALAGAGVVFVALDHIEADDLRRWAAFGLDYLLDPIIPILCVTAAGLAFSWLVVYGSPLCWCGWDR